MESMYSERIRVEPALSPSDAAGGVNTARLSLTAAKGRRVAILVQLGVGVGTTFSATVKQHDAASAGNTKDLTPICYLHKASNATSYTKVDSTDATVAPAAVNTLAGTVIVELDLDELDDANSYSYVSLAIAAPGAARLVSASFQIDANHKPAHENVI